MAPTWPPRSLQEHHRKHTTGKDAGCFEDLAGRTSPPLTVGEYEARSLQAFNTSWGEFEAEHASLAVAGEYLPPRAYHVDDDLVVAVTNVERARFITCFHEHFDRPHGVDPGPAATVGQRVLRYRRRLTDEERGGMVRNVRRRRGV